MAKANSKAPTSGTPLISTISTQCETPWLQVKFCNLVFPFRYPNSPTIPRYSITCLIDPVEHKEFLDGIRCIEKDEKVESIVKNDTAKSEGKSIFTGDLIIKFQTKDKVPVHIAGESEEESLVITLEEELKKGDKIKVIYDILRYTKKHTATVEHGLSFKLKKIYFDKDKRY